MALVTAAMPCHVAHLVAHRVSAPACERLARPLLCRRSSVAVAAARDTQFQELALWAAARGVEAPRAVPGPQGLVTSAPAVRGELLCSVPESTWVTPAIVAASPVGAVAAGLEPWVALSLWLLSERADPSEEWGAYVAALPEDPGSPVLWSDAELAELAGTQLLAAVEGYR